MKLVGLPTVMLIISSVIRLHNVMKQALVLQSAVTTEISILPISQSTSRYEEEYPPLLF